MTKSLLFLPDISGFTEFVQTTEKEHSQHVIAELLEVLIEANTQDLQLAEIEGDALFFYKENEVPSLEMLLAQAETMFTAFYSHLKLLEKNRICPCNACESAVNLQLKIIAHIGELQFIHIQDKRKPFGVQVIEVHRLLKNNVASDNYLLLSKDLVDQINLQKNYYSKLFKFEEGKNEYDGKTINYLYSNIKKGELKLRPFAQAKKLSFSAPPNLVFKFEFPISASQLLEYITNYTYRNHWAKGVDELNFNENEVTRSGSEHLCVINGKQLNFTVVTKAGKPGQFVYGELTTSPSFVDEFYQFYTISPLSKNSCQLMVESYFIAKSPIKKIMIAFVFKGAVKKSIQKSLDSLLQFAKAY